MANPTQFEPFEPQSHPACASCESMLTDALDGMLSPADQAWFDAHIAVCEHCSEMFGDAQRGAAWLQMLKAPRPEPSSQLLEKILAQTSDGMNPLERGEAVVPGGASVAHSTPPEMPVQPWRAPVVPFRPRTSTSPRWLPSFHNPSFDPRLAMTAAMAFFSIALTLNLTGVRLDQINVADLNPSTLKRSFYEAEGDAARRYDSLRVVHVLESRVEDLKAAGVDINLNSGTGEPRAVHPEPPAAPMQHDQDPDQPQHTPRRGVSHLAVPYGSPVILPASETLQSIAIAQQKWGRA